MRRTTLISILAVSGLGLVGLAVATASTMSTNRELALASAMSMKAVAATPAAMPAQFDPGETAVMLSRLNLSPKHLAAAGLTVEETQLVIGRMMAHLVAHNSNGEFAAATRALNQANARAARFPTQPRRRNATPTTPANPAPDSPGAPVDGPSAGDGGAAGQPAAGPAVAPPPNMPEIRANLNSKLDLAFNAVLQELPAAKSTKLANMRANAKWELPLHYLVVAPNSRTDEQWLKLKGAIAHVGTAAQQGFEPDAAPLAIFNEANADAAVSGALSDMNSRLAGIKAAWREVLGP